MGTPIYMSPEQCRGTRGVDHRSDIYSLGVIFYEMLVGQPPFVSEGFGDLVNMHLNVPPAPARSKRPELPVALDAIVMKMLSKNPEERYADMADFQAALKTSGTHQIVSSPDLVRTHGKGMPVSPASPMHDTTFSAGTGERLETQVGGGRGKMVAIGVIAAAAIGGGIFWWQGGQPAGKTPDKVAVTTPPARPAPSTTPPVAPVTPPRPAVAPVTKIELRLASVPSGARVVDNVDGELLGVTPLVLTRPRGGTLTVRLEKDGYQPSTRTMPLDGDRAFELTLEQQKAKKKEHRPPREREPSTSEPAKL
jgi:serine/threonine-protein kinase